MSAQADHKREVSGQINENQGKARIPLTAPGKRSSFELRSKVLQGGGLAPLFSKSLNTKSPDMWLKDIRSLTIWTKD